MTNSAKNFHGKFLNSQSSQNNSVNSKINMNEIKVKLIEIIEEKFVDDE